MRSIWDDAVDLVDWIPDTIWDSVLVMALLYGAILVAVIEVHLWLDRRAGKKQ